MYIPADGADGAAGQDDSLPGGRGGDGGAGGDAGYGGGGGGGPSVGIVCANSASVTCADLAFASGTPGMGGGNGADGMKGVVANAYGCASTACSTPAPSTPTPTFFAPSATPTPRVYFLLNGTQTTQITVPVGGKDYNTQCPGCSDELILVDEGGRLCATKKATLYVGVGNAIPAYDATPPVDQLPDTRTTEALIKRMPAVPGCSSGQVAGCSAGEDLVIQTIDCSTHTQLEVITMHHAVVYPTPALSWVLNGTPIPVSTPLPVPIGGEKFANSCPGCPGTLVLRDTGARFCSSGSGQKAQVQVSFDEATQPYLGQFADVNATDVLVASLPPALAYGTFPAGDHVLRLRHRRHLPHDDAERRVLRDTHADADRDGDPREYADSYQYADTDGGRANGHAKCATHHHADPDDRRDEHANRHPDGHSNTDRAGRWLQLAHRRDSGADDQRVVDDKYDQLSRPARATDTAARRCARSLLFRRQRHADGDSHRQYDRCARRLLRRHAGLDGASALHRLVPAAAGGHVRRLRAHAAHAGPVRAAADIQRHTGCGVVWAVTRTEL
jgi:hypothetical protein